MSKIRIKILSVILALICVLSPVSVFTGVTAFAADFNDINVDSVFLKQKTSVTCTLSSAAMMLRRTAICAEYTNWGEITEESIRKDAWVDGVGLLWSISTYGMKVGHGYFSGSDTKMDMIDLLEKYPQGIVIYNSGKGGQSHAVFLCDYDEQSDVFYVADPASSAPVGRIKLSESTIVGETQDEQIANISAYWYVSDPVVNVKNGIYTVEGGNNSSDNSQNKYDPSGDLTSFDASMKRVSDYYVVTDNSSAGAALRTGPSGNSQAADYVKKGEILFITHKGNNKFGALWYKTSDNKYIFSSNVVPFKEYSDEIKKFNSTSSDSKGTYSLIADSSLRIEPAEGNNVVATVKNGTLLYVVETGVNSVGAKWLKTEDGYYVKAGETVFKSADKLSSVGFEGNVNIISGIYYSNAVEDEIVDTVFEPSKYKITASALNVRKSPVNGSIIGTLSKGTVVQVVAASDGWGKISYNGQIGWISFDYAVRVDENAKPLEITAVKLSSSKVETGNNIVCSVEMSDDVKCIYTFSLYDIDGNLISKNSYGQVKNVFTYKTVKSGYYYFKVDAVDSSERSVSSYSGNFVVYDKLQIDSVRSNVDSFTYVYDTITWTSAVSCFSDNAKYYYYLYNGDKLVCETESEIPEFSYTPEEDGVYTLKVYMYDEFTKTDIISSNPVNVYSALTIDSINLSATSALVNSEIACDITVSGGTGEYTYCFSVFNDGKLIKNGSFSKNDSTVQKFSKSGTYTFFCTVMDTGSTIVSSFSADIVIFDQMKGDVNSDGQITAVDARLVLRHSASLENLTDSNLVAADVNNDNKVTALDARYILRYSARIDNTLG